MLTSNESNRALICEFVSKKADNTLEAYLKDENKAWSEDSDGETKVYLVKDSSDKIALFFSIKCGLLVCENSEDILSKDEEEAVNNYLLALKENDDKIKTNMYDAIISTYGLARGDHLCDIAMRRLETKNEGKEIGQSDHTINVPMCISAIELRHLCKNENYDVPEEINIPLGFGVFWEIIVPFIIEITNKVGCKYIYLFAADKTVEEDSEARKLIRHYKNNFKFSECTEGIKLIKPEYDNHCYGLIQCVSDLENNREAIWHEFSDV